MTDVQNCSFKNAKKKSANKVTLTTLSKHLKGRFKGACVGDHILPKKVKGEFAPTGPKHASSILA